MEHPSAAAVFDAIVVGAGPAGCNAAARLAAAGARVLLLEKEKLPRYKTCGGGVVARAAKYGELPAPPVVQRALPAATLHLLTSGLHFEVQRPEPFLFMTMRAAVDAWWCDRARAAGAEVRDACSVQGLVQERESVEVQTPSGRLRARWVLGADGARSRVARWAGWETDVPAVPALEWEVPVREETLRRHAGAARFDFEVVPAGYAWVFPKGEHLSVGVLSTRRGAQDLNGVLQHYMERLGIEPSGTVQRHGALLPVAPRPGGAALGRVLLCGDAAGFADPVTGEGISYALQSGALAAAAVLAGAPEPSRVRSHYRRALEQEILGELRWARRLGRILERPALRTALFRRAGEPLCEAMADVVSGRRSYRLSLYSPAHLGKLLRWLRS